MGFIDSKVGFAKLYDCPLPNQQITRPMKHQQ
jgi:hypothetical protein